MDRLIGYKLSPFISQKIRRGLSAGRVQSVALRLVVDREEEIRAFKPEEYWSIDAKFTNPPERKSFAAALAGKVDDKAKIKITSKEESDKILSDLEGAEYIVQSVKKGTRKKSPTPPFITSTLQQEASRRLSFQAKRTMKAAQELYEGVEVAGHGTLGLITYMRTDSCGSPRRHGLPATPLLQRLTARSTCLRSPGILSPRAIFRTATRPFAPPPPPLPRRW